MNVMVVQRQLVPIRYFSSCRPTNLQKKHRGRIYGMQAFQWTLVEETGFGRQGRM